MDQSPQPNSNTNAPELMIRKPVAINGVLHFLGATDYPSGVSLLCFDLDSEQWKKKMIHGPATEDGKVPDRSTISITEFHGSLCMVKATEPYTDIWLLIDSDKSAWRKIYTIPEKLCPRNCLPLMIPPDGEKILLQHFTIFDALIYLKIYDTRTAICKYDDKMPQGIAGVCSSCCLLSTKV
jgi:F-box interacting protein